MELHLELLVFSQVLLNYLILLGLIEKGFYKEYFEKKIANPVGWKSLKLTLCFPLRKQCVFPLHCSLSSLFFSPFLHLRSFIHQCSAANWLENVSGLTMFESPRLLSDNTCPTS